MPQENQVLRCFSCETFQVHIVKKAKKWECKMCGAKQSFKRHYGKGTGKDCRNHVMKLNKLRFTKSDMPSLTEEETLKEIPQQSEPNLEQEPVPKSVPPERKVTSKWEQYLDEDSNEIEDELFKQEKRRKISYEFNEVLQPCKESY